jgi:endonuclease YncB( thermonuclease family)
VPKASAASPLCVRRGKAVKAIALALGMTLAASLPAAGQPAVSGRATVIDGDTIEVRGKRFRLHGIDAPEGAQTCRRPNGREWDCGEKATVALDSFLGRTSVRCQPNGDVHGNRLIAVCFKGSEDINRWLVANGWAMASRRFSEAYVPDEHQARAARRGLWSGTFVMPWDWRNGQRR